MSTFKGTFLVVLLCSASIFGYTVTTDDGSGADAHIFRATCTNDGSSTMLEVDDLYNATYWKKVYLRFDVSSCQSTETGAATLKLVLAEDFNNVGGLTISVYGLKDGDAGEDWDETVISWFDAPANDTGSGSLLLSNAVYLGEINGDEYIPAGTTIEFSDPNLSDFVNTDTDSNVTLILTAAAWWYTPAKFASREHLSLPAPTLDLIPNFDYTITTDEGSGADAHIFRATGTNDGNSTMLEVDDLYNSSYWKKVYLRFDVSNCQLANVGAVALKLVLAEDFNNSTGFAINVYGLEDGDAGEDWDETVISWFDAPANDTGSGSLLLSNAVYLGEINGDAYIPAGTTIEFSDPNLINFVNTDTDSNITLILTAAAWWYTPTKFVAREHLSLPAPTLEIIRNPLPVEASVDAHIFRTTGTNDGNSTMLEVDDLYNMAYWKKVYLKFGVSPCQLPIGNADLKLVMAEDFNNASGLSISVYGLTDNDAGEDWDETVISWFDAPANDTGSGSLLLSNAVYLGEIDAGTYVPAGTTIEFSNPLLQEFVNTDTDSQITLILTAATQWFIPAKFASREHLSLPAPTLELTSYNYATIIIPDNALPVVTYAADELKYHLQKATGEAPLINRECGYKGIGKLAFYLGDCNATNQAGIDVNNLPANGYKLLTSGNNLFLVGDDNDGDVLGVMSENSTRVGTLLATYKWLEDQIGVRWLWPGELGTIIPQIEIGQFSFGTWDTTGQPLLFSVANDSGSGSNGWSSPTVASSYQNVQSIWLRRHQFCRSIESNYGHGFTDYWDRFNSSDPNFFNLLPDSTRRPDPMHMGGAGQYVSLCLNNDDLWDQIVGDWSTARTSFRPWINCSENDTPSKCTCSSCMSWDVFDPDCNDWVNRLSNATTAFDLSQSSWYKNLGSLSDRHAEFWLAVQDVTEDTDPCAIVVAFAYENFANPPIQTQLNNRVVVGIVPTLYFPWTDYERDKFEDQWEGWATTGAKLYLRPNYFLEGHNMPIFFADKFGQDFAFAYQRGMIGTMFDSLTGQWATQGPNLYMLGRINHVADVNDVNGILDEYYSAFGSAKTSVKSYFEYLKGISDNVTEPVNWASFFVFAPDIFTTAVIQNARGYLDQAYQQASGDPCATARIDFLDQGLTHSELTIEAQVAWENWNENGDIDGWNEAYQDLETYRANHDVNFISNMAFLDTYENMVWRHDVPLQVSRPIGTLTAVYYDEITADMNAISIRDLNSSGSAWFVLDLGASSAVSRFNWYNHKTVVTLFNAKGVKIWVAPNESSPSFNPWGYSCYTSCVFDGNLVPQTNDANALRTADINDVNKRYFLFQVTSNGWGELGIWNSLLSGINSTGFCGGLDVVSKYTEKFQDITIGTASAWTDVDLSSYGVGANQVVEIGIRNSSTSTARDAGIRIKGSSLARKIVLHAATTAGWDMTTMTVKTDANKKIQAYATSTSDVHFYLVGIWNSGDYTEKFQALTIGTTGSWVDSADLSTYGVGANQVIAVMASKKSTTAYIAGIRANGSSLDRKLTLHASTSSAADCLVMQAQADANKKIEVWKGNTSVTFTLLGYWTTAPGTYTEKFVDVGKPASSATWTSRSLSGQSVPANAICEMLIANASTSNHNNVGVRRTGSSLSRLFDIHKSSASTARECGMMHVEVNSSSNIQQYLQNSGDTANFYLLGYWN